MQRIIIIIFILVLCLSTCSTGYKISNLVYGVGISTIEFDLNKPATSVRTSEGGVCTGVKMGTHWRCPWIGKEIKLIIK